MNWKIPCNSSDQFYSINAQFAWRDWENPRDTCQDSWSPDERIHMKNSSVGLMHSNAGWISKALLFNIKQLTVRTLLPIREQKHIPISHILRLGLWSTSTWITLGPINLKKQNKQTPWLYSVSVLYRPSDRRLSAKLVATLADRGCRVVSATYPQAVNFGFLDRSCFFSFK
jgi:hypothetical protein